MMSMRVSFIVAILVAIYAPLCFGLQSNYWTWIGGSNTAGGASTKGTTGVADYNNIPRSRRAAATILPAINASNTYLYGGYVFTGANTYMNDMWSLEMYTNGTAAFAYVDGAEANTKAVYGTKGVATNSTVRPGSAEGRMDVDSQGNVWLYTSSGSDASQDNVALSDFWYYNVSSKMWTWMFGCGIGAASNQGHLCPFVFYNDESTYSFNVPYNTSFFNPPTSANAVFHVDHNNNLWLFGGYYYDGNSYFTSYLYMFNMTSWTWIIFGGDENHENSASWPAARSEAASAMDSNRRFIYIYGGKTGDATNDLWRLDTATNPPSWTMMIAATANTADNIASSQLGARAGHCMLMAYNRLFIFGGSESGTASGRNNRLWQINLESNNYAQTYHTGSTSNAVSSTFGTINTPASSNIIGARYFHSCWFDRSNDNFYAFGGQIGTSSTSFWNDFWTINLALLIPQVTNVNITGCVDGWRNCPVQGGLNVTFTGIRFQTGATMTSNICNGPATFDSTTPDSKATCTLAYGIADSTITVSVTTTNGGTSLKASTPLIHFAPAPIVSSVDGGLCMAAANNNSLINCPVFGGSILTIIGSNFNTGGNLTSKLCDGVATLDLTTPDTKATCKLAAGMAGWSGPFIVTTNGGNSSISNAPNISYAPAPMIASVFINNTCIRISNSSSDWLCSVFGSGGMVTIYGSRFNTGGNLTSSLCSNNVATILNDSIATCMMAGGSPGMTVTLVVLTNGGYSLASGAPNITFPPTPIVTAFNGVCQQNGSNANLFNCPISGGGLITITGNNFDKAGPITSNLCQGPIRLDPSTPNTKAVCMLAAGANNFTIPLIVTTYGGYSVNNVSANFTFAYTADFIAPAPIVSSVNGGLCMAAANSSSLMNCPIFGGSILTIIGSNFNTGGNLTSMICDGPVMLDWNMPDTKATCKLMAGMPGQSVPFIVSTTNGGNSNATNASFISISYALPPVITSLSGACFKVANSSAYNNCPVSGGVNVTVTGMNFNTGGSNLTFSFCSGMPTLDYTTPDTKAYCIIAQGMPGSGSTAFAFSSNGGRSNMSIDFMLSYANVPIVTGLSASSCTASGNNLKYCSADGTDTITIIGMHFDTSLVPPTSSVCQGNLTSYNNTMLTCKLKAGTPGSLINVTVSTMNGGNSSLLSALTIRYAKTPTLTSLSGCMANGNSLVNCPISGGAAITFIGTNFMYPISISSSICGGPLMPDSTSPDTKATCMLATGTQGQSVNIIFTTDGGVSNTLTLAYAPAPTVTKVEGSPSCTNSSNSLTNCPNTGGDTITLTGTNFNTGGSLSSNVCKGLVTIVSDTMATCALAGNVDVTPTNTTAIVTVVVNTTNGGASSPSGAPTISYIYVAPIPSSSSSSGGGASASSGTSVVTSTSGGDTSSSPGSGTETSTSSTGSVDMSSTGSTVSAGVKVASPAVSAIVAVIALVIATMI